MDTTMASERTAAGSASCRVGIDDVFGMTHSVRSAAAIDAWEQAVFAAAAHSKNAGAEIEKALELEPNFPAALCLSGFSLLFKGRKEHIPAVRTILDRVRRCCGETNASERYLIAALQAWHDDDYGETDRQLTKLLALHPTSLFAVKLHHGFLFLAGQTARMRESIESVLPRWHDNVPGYGFVLGCHAFALEETGALAEALRVGTDAAQREPRDAWGVHAVCHVFEMRDEAEAGARWLDERRESYAHCNNFRGHVVWHRALFDLTLERYEEALQRYDAEIASDWIGDYRDMSNCASLLWRLEDVGVAVGERWEQLGRIAETWGLDCGSAFATAHYALALARTGRRAQIATILRRIQQAAPRGTQTRLQKEKGRALVAGIERLVDGDSRAALLEFERARGDFAELGGSSAQRDLFAQLHITAAIEGSPARARALLQERLAERPDNAWAHAKLLELA